MQVTVFQKDKILEVRDKVNRGIQGPLLNYNSRDAQQKGAPRPALPRPARLGGSRPPSGTQQGTLATSAAAGE